MDAPAPFTVDVTRTDGALVIAPEGEVDIATVSVIRDALDGNRFEADLLVLDCRRVEFMDTSGLQLLVQLRRRCEESGRAFAVVRGPRGVQRLLDIAGLTPILRMVDSPEEAVADGGAGTG
ncbi:MAG TPA: STAS domain-containing protein [Solirubrobacteraceae bacterium]